MSKPTPIYKTKQQHDTFTGALLALGITYLREYRFDAKRLWRADYCIPDYKIIIEVEGGIWTNGRHTRSLGFLGDMEKYNAATLAGYRVYRVEPNKLMTDGIKLVRQTIALQNQ
jgi:hypothetical protein